MDDYLKCDECGCSDLSCWNQEYTAKYRGSVRCKSCGNTQTGMGKKIKADPDAPDRKDIDDARRQQGMPVESVKTFKQFVTENHLLVEEASESEVRRYFDYLYDSKFVEFPFTVGKGKHITVVWNKPGKNPHTNGAYHHTISGTPGDHRAEENNVHQQKRNLELNKVSMGGLRVLLSTGSAKKAIKFVEQNR